MMQKPIRAVIIGAGRIGATFDRPGDTDVLTHAHALSKNPAFNLVGFMDQDQQSAKKAADRWQVNTIDGFSELKKLSPDLVVVATPDVSHAKILEVLLDDVRPGLILSEKPFTQSWAQACELKEKIKNHSCILGINYQRRYDPDIASLRSSISGKEFGEILACQLIYSKGINHNGSHGIDLMRYLFSGEPHSALVTQKRFDYCDSDPTVGATLYFDRTPVQLIPGDERHYSIFEFDILFETRRFRWSNSGMILDESRPAADPFYDGYRELSHFSSRKSQLNSALKKLYNNISEVLNGDSSSFEIGWEKTLETQRICSLLGSTDIVGNLSLGEGLTSCLKKLS